MSTLRPSNTDKSQNYTQTQRAIHSNMMGTLQEKSTRKTSLQVLEKGNGETNTNALYCHGFLKIFWRA